jgi:hypothetical protein
MLRFGMLVTAALIANQEMTGRFAENNLHVSSLSQLRNTKGFLSLCSLSALMAASALTGQIQINTIFHYGRRARSCD